MQRVLDDVGERAGDEGAIDEHARERTPSTSLRNLDAAGEAGAVRIDDLGDEFGDIDRRRFTWGDEAKLENSEAIWRSSLT